MVRMMIFVIKNKQMMKLGLDLLDFVPSQPAGFFKSLKMKGPLSFTEGFKKWAQSSGKSVPL